MSIMISYRHDNETKVCVGNSPDRTATLSSFGFYCKVPRASLALLLPPRLRSRRGRCGLFSRISMNSKFVGHSQRQIFSGEEASISSYPRRKTVELLTVFDDSISVTEWHRIQLHGGQVCSHVVQRAGVLAKTYWR